MNAQKSLQSVDSTGIRQQDQFSPSQSPERWKQLESKYLKYIALLKSKADKSQKKLTNTNKYIQLAYCLKYKLQTRLMDAFKTLELKEGNQQIKGMKTSQSQNKKKKIEQGKMKRLVEFRDRIQYVVNKHRRSAFLLLKKRSQQKQKIHKQLVNGTKNNSPSKSKFSNNQKHLLAIKQLQKLQSTINNYSLLSPNQQLLFLKTQNSKLKEEIKVHKDQIKHLNKQLQSTHQRMEMELLKKSLALMESQVDSQQKQELIKQYQIQLQCRINSNNRVLLFSLQDFEVERKRLQLVNQKLYKEFENTKQTFIEEIKNQNDIINQLKSKLGRTSVSLSENNAELESLRAYKFENQYQKQCERYKQIIRLNSLQLPLKSSQLKSSMALQILKYIQSLVSKELPETNISQYLTKTQTVILQSIQQKLNTNPNPTTIKNRLIKLNSLQRSIALEQNVKVSNQELHSFLDIFQVQNEPPNTSIDTKIQEQLENKILSLNQRLFDVRELVLSLLQSIQIRNPTKQLLSLIQNINDTFEFSESEKESFHGGRKSLFQKLFS